MILTVTPTLFLYDNVYGHLRYSYNFLSAAPFRLNPLRLTSHTTHSPFCKVSSSGSVRNIFIVGFWRFRNCNSSIDNMVFALHQRRATCVRALGLKGAPAFCCLEPPVWRGIKMHWNWKHNTCVSAAFASCLFRTVLVHTYITVKRDAYKCNCYFVPRVSTVGCISTIVMCDV